MLHRFKSARSVSIAIALLIVVAAWLPAVQSMATEVVNSGLKQTLVTYGSLRALNGFVSVIQGTEVSAGPILGQVTVSIGQVLAPVNTLLEQVSTVMLWATVSFGLQKALLALSGNVVVSALISVTAISWAALHFLGRQMPWLNRLVLIMFLIRFVFPIVAIGSHVVFDNFFMRDLRSAEHSISQAATEAGAGGSPSVLSPTVAVEKAKKIAESLPGVIVQITTSFLIQTVLLPLFMLWALVFLARGLFRQPSARQT